MTRPVAVITGASAGIGAALARVFARHGHELVLVARRGQAMAALADEIAGTGRPRPLVLPLDLGEAGAAARIGDALAARDLTPRFIVNNAGFGLLGPAAKLDRGEQLAMIDLNVRALTELSLTFVDAVARQRGGILNVASIAGFLPGPGMAVYYASKAFVISFSEALHHELKPKGVRVTVLCPGPVPTEFQARAGLSGKVRASPMELSAEFVALAGYRGLMAGARMVVPGSLNKLATLMPRFLPRGLVARLMAKVQMRRFSA
jgi:short-subunit dehydrogenase